MAQHDDLDREVRVTVTDEPKMTDPLEAEATLSALARQLERSHPGAAGSLREGLAQSLTVMRLGVPPTLARTLRSTNAIESMIEICRDRSTNVKNWRDGTMALRRCAAGMNEVAEQFRPGQRTPPPPRPSRRQVAAHEPALVLLPGLREACDHRGRQPGRRTLECCVVPK